MGYFPICMDIGASRVLCVGAGPRMEDKAARLEQFGAAVERLPGLSEADLEPRPALVVVGGLEPGAAGAAARLCARANIPVNVVDMPEMCTFIFPALISRGDLAISITTGGKSPALAARLRARIERQLPGRIGEVLEWLAERRRSVRGCPYADRASLLGRAADRALELGRPLDEEEWRNLAAQPCGAPEERGAD